MTKFDITIVSDTICPWCYIGYRRLQKAISLWRKTYPGGSKDVFNITWKPYYLDVALPTTGILIQERMVSRMGEERTASAQKHMASLGAAEGIAIKFEGKTGNTRLSHQLLELARTKGSETQCNVAEELFRLHFGEERDITEVQTLVDAGVGGGLEKEEVEDWLAGDKGGEKTDREAQEVREMGIKGVPKFLLQDGKYPFDGAQDAMDFFEVFMKIKEEAGR